MLCESFPKDLGKTYKDNLQKIKMLNNENIIEFKSRYKALFHDCLRFHRVVEGLGANEDYLNASPKLNPIQQIRISLNDVCRGLNLSSLMQRVASLVLQLTDGYLLKDKVNLAEENNNNYLPQKHRGRTVSSKYKKTYEKKICERCGLKTNHKDKDCIAIGETKPLFKSL